MQCVYLVSIAFCINENLFVMHVMFRKEVTQFFTDLTPFLDLEKRISNQDDFQKAQDVPRMFFFLVNLQNLMSADILF